MNTLTTEGAGPGALLARVPAFWLKICASVLAGALLALSEPTLPLWPLAFIWLVPALWAALAAPTYRQAFQHGLLTGMAFNVGTFYWLINAICALWGLYLADAFVLFLLVCAWQSLFFGALAVGVRAVHRRTGLPLTLIAPVVLVALELVFPFLMPWHFAVSTAWLLPVIQLAEVTGPLGITFCMAMVSGVLYDSLMARGERRPLPRWRLLGVTLTLLIVVGFGLVRIRQLDARWQAAPKVKIGVVQSNIQAGWRSQNEGLGGFNEQTAARLRKQELGKHLVATTQLTRAGAALIVWPESAFPSNLPHHDTGGSLAEAGAYLSFSVPVLLGATTVDPEQRWFNSALLIEPNTRPHTKQQISGHYDKIALFQFGEDLPLLKWFPALRDLLPASIGKYEPGKAMTTFALPDPRAAAGAFRVAPLICQDDMRTDLGAAAGRLHPHVLVSIGNDGWFGKDRAPWQHLAHAVFRAVEQRTGLVRAEQTGVSAFIDATGRVRRHLKPTAPLDLTTLPASTLVDEVAMLEGGHTFYATAGTLWGRGELFGLLMLAALGGMLALPRRLYRRQPTYRLAPLGKLSSQEC